MATTTKPTDQEREAAHQKRRAAELRAQNVADTLALLKSRRSPHKYAYDLEEIPEVKAEWDALVAKLEAVRDEAEGAFEAADRDFHALEHAAGECSCKAFDAEVRS